MNRNPGDYKLGKLLWLLGLAFCGLFSCRTGRSALPARTDVRPGNQAAATQASGPVLPTLNDWLAHCPLSHPAFTANVEKPEIIHVPDSDALQLECSMLLRAKKSVRLTESPITVYFYFIGGGKVYEQRRKEDSGIQDWSLPSWSNSSPLAVGETTTSVQYSGSWGKGGDTYFQVVAGSNGRHLLVLPPGQYSVVCDVTVDYLEGSGEQDAEFRRASWMVKCPDQIVID